MQKLNIRLKEGQVEFHGNAIPLELVESNRKTVGLTVTPDMRVVLRISQGLSTEEQQRFLDRKESWLYKQLLYFEQFHPRQTIRTWQAGETQFFLGKEYRLKIEESKHWAITVGKEYILIHTPYPERVDLIQSHYRQWLKSQAEELFIKLHYKLQKSNEQKLGYWLDPPEVKYFKSKWGTYDPKTRKYTMNYMLMQAPLRSIEYVILHEVCHAKYLNHDRYFFNLLTSVEPSWRKWKDRMERMLA